MPPAYRFTRLALFSAIAAWLLLNSAQATAQENRPPQSGWFGVIEGGTPESVEAYLKSGA